MNCIACEDMACKVFTVKTEIWTGFCTKKDSPKYHRTVTGEDGCTFTQELNILTGI